MSVKSTAARTRSGSGAGRTPVMKLLDFINGRIIAVESQPRVAPRHFDETRTRNMRGQPAAVVGREEGEVLSMQYKRRNLD
jgi:hypothetical protein